MVVYLVQHGEATSKDVNPDRPLTEKGRQDAQNVAKFAAKLDLDIGHIYHSGKLRAQQTADTLAGELLQGQTAEDHDGLGPVDDVAPIAEEVESTDTPVMLVGHLPFMPRMTGYLVAGDEDADIVNYHNGAIVCLVGDDEGWEVDWILTPTMASV